MKVRISETNKIKDMQLIDKTTGCDWVKDFIGNNGGFGNLYDDFRKVEEPCCGELYETSQKNYDWWAGVIAGINYKEQIVDDFIKKYGSKEVYEILCGVGNYDLELQAFFEVSALKEAFGEVNL